MTKRIYLKLAVTSIFLLTVVPGFSQLTNTSYFMRGVPQVYQINPAFQPGCKFFIGFPGISPLQARVQNQPLALNDLLSYNDSIGQLITPIHPFGDVKSFLNALNDRNFINADVGVPIASIGFGSPSDGKFIAFDITQRISTSINYPRDLFRLPLVGPDSGMNFDFNGFGIDAMVYTELAMNVSRKLGEKVTVGWRGKILLGQANLSTTKFDVTLSTGEESWPVHSNIVMNAALPFLDVQYDSEGMIDFENTDVLPNIEKEIPGLVFNPKNIGLAMDIGVDVRPMDWLQVSASVVDFGSIKWKDNVYNLENNGDYEFEGLNFTPNQTNIDTIINNLTDELTERFKFRADSTSSPYRTWLPTKIYLGAALYVHPKISFGVLSRSEIYKGSLRQQFTVSANLYPIRMISTSFSYSVIEGTYKNLGLGLALKAFPFNFYIITDTGPSIYFWPTDATNMNLRIGMNIMFGCKQKKEPKFDLPLVN